MKTVSSNLLIYGAAHFLVDAITVSVLFSAITSHAFSADMATYLILTYNLLAFGLQVFVGFFVDAIRAPRFSALAGILLSGISTLLFVSWPVPAIVLAGVGNAMFHVGGGIVSLSLTPQRAASPGAFVAPGALGLMAGTLLGKGGQFIAWPFLLAAALLAVGILLVPKPSMYPSRAATPAGSGFKAEYILFLVLFVIAIRSVVGFAVAFPWKSDTGLLVMLTISVVLGKGVGGLLADRFGWSFTAVGSLVASVPLLTLGPGIPVLGMIGMFLFNITMPVTLAMVSNMVPGRPGVAFGLTCLALVLGTVPAFSMLQPGLKDPWFIDAAILVSALSLYIALRYYRRTHPENEARAPALSRIRPGRQLPEEV